MNTNVTGKNTDFKIVIPARYHSQRLPGKPLRLIAGRPLIEYTYRNAADSGASEVIVATDDKRIAECVAEFDGEYCMTSAAHLSGSDRVDEVAKKRGWDDDVVIVNVQGDEPFISAQSMGMLVTDLSEHPEAAIGTLASAHRADESGYNDCNRVKLVCDNHSYALYFSREAIPSAADEWLCHHGIYAYRRGYLHKFASLSQPLIEKCENLEQLRVLAVGDKIRVRLIAAPACFGIDSESDLERADHLIKTGKKL